MVDQVTIDGTRYPYSEYSNCEYDLILSNYIFEFKTSSTDSISLACNPVDSKLYSKAKFLYEQVRYIHSMKTSRDHMLKCYQREGRTDEASQVERA